MHFTKVKNKKNKCKHPLLLARPKLQKYANLLYAKFSVLESLRHLESQHLLSQSPSSRDIGVTEADCKYA